MQFTKISWPQISLALLPHCNCFTSLNTLLIPKAKNLLNNSIRIQNLKLLESMVSFLGTVRPTSFSIPSLAPCSKRYTTLYTSRISFPPFGFSPFKRIIHACLQSSMFCFYALVIWGIDDFYGFDCILNVFDYLGSFCF